MGLRRSRPERPAHRFHQICTRLAPHPRSVNEEDVTQVFISSEEIRRRVLELGAGISRDYAGRTPILVGILKGSVIFLADLVRALSIEVEVDFISISSYGRGTTSSGSVRLLKDLDADINGRDVIVVEDIVDSGLSLEYIRRNLLVRRPASLAIAALLDKPQRRTQEIEVRYVGFTVPDEFVVGYGLDYQERYRGVPHIGVLEPAEIEEGGA